MPHSDWPKPGWSSSSAVPRLVKMTGCRWWQHAAAALSRWPLFFPSKLPPPPVLGRPEQQLHMQHPGDFDFLSSLARTMRDLTVATFCSIQQQDPGSGLFWKLWKCTKVKAESKQGTTSVLKCNDPADLEALNSLILKKVSCHIPLIQNSNLISKLCPGAQSEVHPQCVHRAAKTEHGCPNNPFIRCHSYRQLLWGEFWDLYVFLIGDQGVGQPVAVLHTTPTTSFKASGTVKATLKTFKANSYSPKATPKTSISFHKYSQSRSNSVNQQIWANMFKTS